MKKTNFEEKNFGQIQLVCNRQIDAGFPTLKDRRRYFGFPTMTNLLAAGNGFGAICVDLMYRHYILNAAAKAGSYANM